MRAIRLLQTAVLWMKTPPVEVPMRRSLSNGRHAKRQSICYIVSLSGNSWSNESGARPIMHFQRALVKYRIVNGSIHLVALRQFFAPLSSLVAAPALSQRACPNKGQRGWQSIRALGKHQIHRKATPRLWFLAFYNINLTWDGIFICC
jgi:hypothetical protein